MADSELRPTHLPTDEHFARWAQRSRDQPLRMLSSACLTGLAVGYDGSDYGGYPAARALIERPEVRTFGFCPEDFAFGTPRDLCDIHGGDGFDVLDGRARVYNDRGEDWTADMLEAAEEMARFARAQAVDAAAAPSEPGIWRYAIARTAAMTGAHQRAAPSRA